MTAARRLAAILAADVVGYSRLMGEDEAGTARAVSERRFPPFLNDRLTSSPVVCSAQIVVIPRRRGDAGCR